jgi:hypothetical protein
MHDASERLCAFRSAQGDFGKQRKQHPLAVEFIAMHRSEEA